MTNQACAKKKGRITCVLLVFNWFSLNLTCKPEAPSNEINAGMQFMFQSFVGFTVRFRIDVLQHVCQVLSAQVIYLVAVSVILAVSASCLDCFRPPACFRPPGCFAQIKLFRIQGWLLRPAAAAAWLAAFSHACPASRSPIGSCGE